MSPLGGCIADWLKKRPGPFSGATEQAAFDAAYEKWPSKSKFTVEEFIAALDRAGYRAVERRAHSQGNSSYFLLCLPEGN